MKKLIKNKIYESKYNKQFRYKYIGELNNYFRFISIGKHDCKFNEDKIPLIILLNKFELNCIKGF